MKTPENIYYPPKSDSASDHTFDMSDLRQAEDLLEDEKKLFQGAANLAKCDRERVAGGEPKRYVPGTLNDRAVVVDPKTGIAKIYDVNKFDQHAVVLDPKTGIVTVAPGPEVTYRQWGADEGKITGEKLKVSPDTEVLVFNSPIPKESNYISE